MKTVEVVFVEFEDARIDSSGGIMSYLVNLSQYLMHKGVKTYLIGVDVKADGTIPNVEKTPFYRFIPVMKTTRGTNASFIFNLMLKVPFLQIPKLTIIHSQRPDTLFPFVIFNRNNPKVCTLHGRHDVAVHHKKGILFGRIYDILQYVAFKCALVLIAVDTDTKKYYMEKYPWLRNKIVIIPPGIDVEKFRPLARDTLRRKYGFEREEKIVIFVGRLEKEKNLDLLIYSFALVKERVKCAKLLLIGEGKEKQRLKSIIEEMALKDVFLWNTVSHDKMPEILNCADVFAFCSLYEGSPIIIKEALACGLPIVSVDVGDVRQVIDGIDGCYIAQRDREDFAKKLVKCLREQKRVRTDDIISRIDYDTTSRETMRIYKSVIKKTRHLITDST